MRREGQRGTNRATYCALEKHPDVIRLGAAALGLLLAGCGSGDGQGATATRPELKAGADAFTRYCAACHHADGTGAPGGGPPLAGSPWVNGPEGRLIRIVLGGVRGPLVVGDVSYNREMLAFGAVLSDADIAAILSYVRDRFGRGAPGVSPPAVAEVRAAQQGRAGYWTVEELLQVP